MNIIKFLLFGDSNRKINYDGPKRHTASPATLQSIQHEWENIKMLIAGKQPSQLRQALISADKCLDNALRDVVSGESMGERLKEAKDIYEWNFYQEIWSAHKLRNELVHQAGFDPTYSVVLEKVEIIKKALSKLGVYL